MIRDMGELLLEENILTAESLQEMRRLEKQYSLRLEQILLKKGVVDEPTLLQLQSRQYGFEFLEKLEYESEDSFARVPVLFIQRSRMVPVRRREGRILVALNNPADLHAMDDMRMYFRGESVEFVLSPEAEILRVIHSHFDESASVTRDVMEGLTEEEYAELDQLSEDTLDLANEAPIIRMVNAILSQGIQERASDIHVEPFEKSLDIRYRIDGILHKRLSPPRAIHAGVVSRIKIMANLNIAENRLPQDGRIKVKIAGKDVDIRVSTIPTRYGERVVMRLLNKSDVHYDIETLRMADSMVGVIRKLIAEPNGILLVTGPTGSGKTTTLYAFLTELNQEFRNILTAEDPVEYEMEGISQMQVQEKVGLTFAASLRAMLRQDPDVIMVGEIRDQETARIAIQASLTGHMVLSTLHTNDAPSAVTRLVDMGIEPYLITSTVRAVIAQRLVRVICPHCKTTYDPSEGELEELHLTLADLPGGKLHRGEGCDHCVQTGYRGRAGIYELLLLDEELQREVLRGSDSETLRKLAIQRGMHTLFSDGVRRILSGDTTVEEVMRVT